MKIESIPKTITTRLRAPATLADSVLPFFKANAESLNEWLETLPKLNPVESCRKILPAMETMNLTTIAGPARLAMSEILRPMLVDLIQSTEAQFLDTSFPMSSRVAELASFSIHSQAALADSYKLVILSPEFVQSQPTATDENQATPAPFTDQTQAQVIHRAMRALGRVILRSSQTYQALPSGIWDQINALFLLAEQHQLHTLRIEDQLSLSPSNCCIENTFKQLQFFQLAIPNRFRQREIQSINNMLEETANKIQLTDTHGSGDAQSSFFVTLNSDQPALHISKSVSHDATIRYFNTRLFIEHVMSDAVVARGKDELLSMAGTTTKLPERTVKRLLQCWHQMVTRQFTRQEEHRPVTIYPGLQNIIKKFLYVPESQSAKARMKREGIERFSIAHLELLPTGDHSEHADGGLRSERTVEAMLKASKSNTSADDIWKKAANKKVQGEAQYASGKITNMSAKGYQLGMQGDAQPLVKVGDLIGIESTPGQMEIAVVRRMQIDSHQHVNIGVELIAPSAKVARIVNKEEAIRSRSVLILPSIPAINQPISLVCVSKLQLPDHLVELQIDQTRAKYRLTKLIETNPAFTQYTLQKIEQSA